LQFEHLRLIIAAVRRGWGLTLPSFQCANGVLGHFGTLLGS